MGNDRSDEPTPGKAVYAASGDRQVVSKKRPLHRSRTDENVRPTREQETREADPVHEIDPLMFEDNGPLPQVPEREGYTRRWIRITKGMSNDPDARNIVRATQRGWAPVDPKTLPRALQWLTVQNQTLGSVCGTHDLILMERRNEIQQYVVERKREEIRKRTSAIKRSVFSDYQDLGGRDTGFTSPQDESRMQVERGRKPVNIPDD